jgi:hypothetical protein
MKLYYKYLILCATSLVSANLFAQSYDTLVNKINPTKICFSANGIPTKDTTEKANYKLIDLETRNSRHCYYQARKGNGLKLGGPRQGSANIIIDGEIIRDKSRYQYADTSKQLHITGNRQENGVICYDWYIPKDRLQDTIKANQNINYQKKSGSGISLGGGRSSECFGSNTFPIIAQPVKPKPKNWLQNLFVHRKLKKQVDK